LFKNHFYKGTKKYNLLIYDDFFPNPKSGFRYEEFTYYMENINNLKFLLTPKTYVAVGESPNNQAMYIENLKDKFPKFFDDNKITTFDDKGSYNINTKLFYCVFINNIAEMLPALEKNKIPYKFVDIRSVNGLYSITEDLAKEFGKTEKFKELKKEHDEFFAKFNEKIANKKKPKVLVLMGLPGSYMAATEKSYVGNLVKLAGGENIIKGTEEFKNLNLETALNDKPDFILRTAHAMPDTVTEMFKKEFENNKSWSHFDAVKNNKVVDLDSSMFGMTATYDYQKGLESLYSIFYSN